MVYAELAELVDAHDSGSCAARLPGSSPGFRIQVIFMFRVSLIIEAALH